MKIGFNILLATDYSEAVMNAERYALQFALATDSAISIIHVYDIPIGSVPVDAREFGEVRDNLAKLQLDELKRHRYKLYKSLGYEHKEHECECIVAEGAPSQEIHRITSLRRINLIFTGVHGKTGFGSKLLGNHTRQILKQSEVPVMIIPKEGLLTEIKKIVFATGVRRDELDSIVYVSQLAKAFNAELLVAHSTNDSVSEDFSNFQFNRFISEVRSKVTYHQLHFHLIHNQDVINGIHDFCNVQQADMLVLSPRKRTFIDHLIHPDISISKKISLNTKLVLFCIPEGYTPKLSAFNRSFEKRTD